MFSFPPTSLPRGWSSWVYTTNTTATAGNFNSFLVTNFATNISFPFPSTLTNNGIGVSNNLPYIGFTPSGQLTAGFDQYIMLTSGSILYPMNANGTPNFASPADVEETPPGNELSNPNLIHIDWLTARAKIERNQFERITLQSAWHNRQRKEARGTNPSSFSLSTLRKTAEDPPSVRLRRTGGQPSAFSLSHERAFTMIEIAIAVGVIGFALVVIIGILPQGMTGQKDNRKDARHRQDAPLFSQRHPQRRNAHQW